MLFRSSRCKYIQIDTRVYAGRDVQQARLIRLREDERVDTIWSAPGAGGDWLLEGCAQQGCRVVTNGKPPPVLEPAVAAVVELRPDRYLVHGAAGTDDALEARVRSALPAGQLLSVTNITHGRAEIQLVGTQCVALLSRLCALNFAESEFPNMRAKQTSVAKISQVVVRCDAGGLPAYTLIGARSLGQYLWAALLAAGAELGAFSAASNNQH